MSSFNVYSQSIDQINTNKLEEASREAAFVVEGFKMEINIFDIVAPDYIYARKILQTSLLEKLKRFQSFLVKLNRDLSKAKAVKKPYSDNKTRFQRLVNGKRPAFHSEIEVFIFEGFDNAYNACITPLCLSRIKMDIENWIEHTSKMNKSIALTKESTLESWSQKALMTTKTSLLAELDEKRLRKVLIFKSIMIIVILTLMLVL